MSSAPYTLVKSRGRDLHIKDALKVHIFRDNKIVGYLNNNIVHVSTGLLLDMVDKAGGFHFGILPFLTAALKPDHMGPLLKLLHDTGNLDKCSVNKRVLTGSELAQHFKLLLKVARQQLGKRADVFQWNNPDISSVADLSHRASGLGINLTTDNTPPHLVSSWLDFVTPTLKMEETQAGMGLTSSTPTALTASTPTNFIAGFPCSSNHDEATMASNTLNSAAAYAFSSNQAAFAADSHSSAAAGLANNMGSSNTGSFCSPADPMAETTVTPTTQVAPYNPMGNLFSLPIPFIGPPTCSPLTTLPNNGPKPDGPGAAFSLFTTPSDPEIDELMDLALQPLKKVAVVA